MADPWHAIAASQQRALRLVNDTFTGVVRMGRAGITQPEEAIARLTALVAAVGDLAASSTKPMEALLTNQRNIANTMTAFAQLQRDLADVWTTSPPITPPCWTRWRSWPVPRSASRS